MVTASMFTSAPSRDVQPASRQKKAPPHRRASTLRHVVFGAELFDRCLVLLFFAFLARFPELFELCVTHGQKISSRFLQILGRIFCRLVEHLFEECMEYPAHARPGLLSELHEFPAVNLQHADGDWIARCFIYHRHVLAEAEGVRLGSAGADAVAYAEIEEVVDVALAYPHDGAAYGSEGDDIGVREKHVPAYKRYDFLYRLFGITEVVQYAFCHAGRDDVMPVESPILFLLRPHTRRRLADVMQKGRKPHIQRPLLVGSVLECAEQMLEYVVRMCLILRASYSFLEFRDDVFHEPKLLRDEECLHRALALEDAC